MLIVRIGAMGDILHALPAVTALRVAHPDWQIDWAVEPHWSPLLRSATDATPRMPEMPLVDRIHPVPTKLWRKQPFTRQTAGEIAALRRSLRNCHYDLCIDFQGSIRSAVIGRMAGAQRFLGALHPRETPARWLYRERIATTRPHVIEQYFEIAQAATSIPLVHTAPVLPIDLHAEAWATALLDRLQCGDFVVFTPGAGWGAKRWPAERYGEVAAGLARSGYSTLVNCGPGEEPLAAAVVEASKGAAHAVACTLGQLTSLLRRASLFLGGDTGPLHLAAALQRRVVGIYGPTDPARNGPYGIHSVTLRSPISHSDHTRHPAPEAGLLTLSTQAVLDAALTLLQQSHETPAGPSFGAP